MKNNPWKGLVSYEEKDLEKYEFCGRTRAIGKFYSLITNSLISTLYGRTGCGKTSMLQAGIFPLLRQESYFPVMCRLSLRNEKVTFAEYLIQRVEQELAELGFTCSESTVPIDQVKDLEKYRLWKYFYGHEFKGKEDNIVFPVIVLDQFEEVLINSKDDSLKFLEQVSFLVGDDLLLPDDCYANFRVIISLREDFLYLLEDTIDEGRLQGLRDNRMRLTPLTYEEAEEVISLGDDFIQDADRKSVYKNVCNLAGNRRGHISTNMLSLICSQIYQLYAEKQGNALLSVENIKQLSEDPLKRFYLQSIKGLKESTITFIEKNLVLNGFRRPVTKQEFEAEVSVSDRERLTMGETKILQTITANDNECVELIHDTLARTVFGVAKSKKIISKPQIWGAFIETLFCIVASLTITFDVCVNNFHGGIAICGIILLAINWFYNIASLGNYTFSRLHLLLLWILNCFTFVIAAGSNLLDNVSPIIYLYFMYQSLIPVINMIRMKNSDEKYGFITSLKYVFTLQVVKDCPELIRGTILPACVAMIIGVGSLSGFFMSSWTLWILLPICSMLMFYIIRKYQEKISDTQNQKEYVSLIISSATFVVVQYIAFCHAILTYIAFAIFLIWSIALFCHQKELTLLKRVKYATLSFVLCGIVLPILFLGYNPLGFGNVGRNWIQPKLVSNITIPLLAFHDENGFNGLADRHQKIFEARFLEIDSVKYEFFDWDLLKDYLDYDLLSRYLGDGVQNNSDITLFTKNGPYRWQDMFDTRGNSLYLAKRIKDLEEYPCSNWTEEEFKAISELAAGYHTMGKDSLANSLEVSYFLRRLLQAEIYQCVENDFMTYAGICKNIVDYYLHKRVDPKFKGDYTETFIENADSCIVLRNRTNKYLDISDECFVANYKNKHLSEESTYSVEYRKFKDEGLNISIGDLAKIYNEPLFALLNSYKQAPIPIKWTQKQLDNSDDMIFQTRNTWGKYVVDSIYTEIYEKELTEDVAYNNSSAWFNLFLCRFDRAENYAKKAIEYAKDDYINESTTKYITYTNLITSLFLQDKTADAIKLIRNMKDYPIFDIEGDWKQELFPIQATGMKVTVGEGVCQDFNHFVRVGLLNDTTTTEYRELRHVLSLEHSLISDQGHMIYSNGWNLSVIPDSLYLFYKDEHVRLPLIKKFEVNIIDSIAVCQMDSGGYRFLNLATMGFIGDTYNFAWHFSEGLAAVEIDENIGFINKRGKIMIEPQYPSENWQRGDHYRIAFHDGKAAVTDDNKYYNLIDKKAQWQWDDYCFPYVKWYGVGMIVKQRYQEGNWVYTNSEGIINGAFDSEISDVLAYPDDKSLIPIFNHYNVSGMKHASDLPDFDFDLSGIWYSEDKQSFVYFSKNTSDFMWIGKTNEKGKYFFVTDDEKLKIVMISDKPTSIEVIPVDSERVYLGHDCLLAKIKSL